MTISTTVTSVQYLRNGTTTQWGWPNKIFSAADLVVNDLDTSVPPIATLLGLGTDYTVSNVDVDTGAIVTTTLPGIAGHTLDVRSNIAQNQLTSIKNQGSYLPELHEEFFDRITREVQDLTRKTYAFGIHGPDNEVPPWPALPAASQRANLYLGFSATGQPQATPVAAGTLTQAIFNSFMAGVTFNGGATDGTTTDAYIHRTAAYSGGTPGFVNTALTVQTDVTGTAATADEWPLLARLNNFANGVGSENVAAYLQGNKYGTAPTWGSVIEVIERNAVNNPPFGTIGLEVDVSVNGTDNAVAGNRIGVDVVVRRFNPAGAAAQANWGYRIDASDAGALVGFGYGFFPGSTANIGFDTSHCAINIAAFQMATAQAIIFDGPTTQNHKLTVQGPLLGLDYIVGGVLQTRQLATGGLQVLASQVVGPRSTGWTAMTGTPDQASVFATSTVTLAQLAGRVMALQAMLTTHGLNGP